MNTEVSQLLEESLEDKENGSLCRSNIMFLWMCSVALKSHVGWAKYCGT